MRRFLDALLGRARPLPAKNERLFAISTAMVTLELQLGLKAIDRAGITFKPVESNYFERMSVDLNALLEISTRDTGSRFETKTDQYNFRWIILQDPEFEDLVATIHIVSEELVANGFGEQLLASVFGFTTAEGQHVYWIYNYKRGRFYPFVPRGNRARDNALELRMGSAMERELPVEPELERWYPIWDIPF
ncbi:PspA-associated protein PspAB [Sphaerobacter thermophilus]|uniref:Uncharacterized protein n=1 Tax=Sphaerobacter thermophilus (strain ATCC 49802 / DSM 20745 / KCCM 41009 / NCIMB 13125 / S 6022) TaxID=479434 RepID=D1C2Q4_SPHTD|nr:hypothetical protein [Sphaerobacter thermophilus]ACZ38521.1 conserved hypothetical protein [Sphaerobacter thermophilus DSM 20745]PZN67976.1 MAG: hypothetical protein DIU58_01410 [Sphaerobacter thermophilus]